MSGILGFNRFKILGFVGVICVAVIVAAAMLGGLGEPPNAQVDESGNDVVVNVGSGSPGMVDIVSASLEKTDSGVQSGIVVRDSIGGFGEDEFARFSMLLIFENEEDVLKTFEVSVDINASGVFGLIEDVQTNSVKALQVDVTENTLTTNINLDLEDATKAEWNIYSMYEKYWGNTVVSSAYDFVPDEGLKTTILQTDQTN